MRTLPPKIGLLAAAALLALPFAGCGASARKGADLVAAESFLADIVRNVAGDRLVVATLVPPATDPHEFQPRPADFAGLRDAKAFFVVGKSYETWLLGSSGALEGTKVISLFPDEGTSDPHLWMDPRNTIAALDGLVAALSAIAPEGAEAFSANAKRYAAELGNLDVRTRARFADLPAPRRVLLTNHDSLGHFAAAYGFTIIGTVLPGGSSETSPSAKALAGLLTTIKASGMPAIFLDSGENRALADTVAKEAGVKVVTDLYIEGLSAADGPAPTYIAMIDHDAEAIADALK